MKLVIGNAFRDNLAHENIPPHPQFSWCFNSHTSPPRGSVTLKAVESSTQQTFNCC